jgi:hypothetical protein
MPRPRPEIWCKKCNHHEALGRAIRPDEACPACGGAVYVRRTAPPTPQSHAGVLMRSLLSGRALMFVAFVTLVGMVPDFRARALAAAMVTLAGLKLAMRAMRVGQDGVEFPELSFEELFDVKAVLPSVVFSLVFLLAPTLLLGFALATTVVEEPVMSSATEEGADDADAPPAGFDDDDAWEEAPADPALAAALAGTARRSTDDARAAGERTDTEEAREPRPKTRPSGLSGARTAACVVAFLLFAFAPIALVLYLRTGTTWALFLVPQGVSAISADPKGYLALCLLVWPAFVAQLGLDALTSALPFYLDPIAVVPRTFAVLLVWGLCGLYVRSRAREFDMPIDDEDWAVQPRSSPAPASNETRARPTSISLGDDDPPLVVGALEPPENRQPERTTTRRHDP